MRRLLILISRLPNRRHIFKTNQKIRRLNSKVFLNKLVFSCSILAILCLRFIYALNQSAVKMDSFRLFVLNLQALGPYSALLQFVCELVLSRNKIVTMVCVFFSPEQCFQMFFSLVGCCSAGQCLKKRLFHCG